MLRNKLIWTICLLIVLPALAMAQVTTSSINGTVKNQKGEFLEGAVIKATHLPSGSIYQTTSKKGGTINLPALRVGGPYEIKVSYVGYKTGSIGDVYLQLGEPFTVGLTLESTEANLSNVVVTSTTKAPASQKNGGTSMNISNRVIQSLPSVNRSIQDFARLMPQVKVGNNGPNGNTTGISFAGQNNRYNQFAIDGANASDGFGLASNGANGGQANLNPISIEAIQEIQLVLSPYDVTQGGFTGGGINAVTKSGTNTFHGTIYGQYQNQNYVGKSVQYNSTITRNDYGSFTNQTFGASLGGPIIKNKLFFYANIEKFDKSVPLAYDPTVTGSGSKVNADTLTAIRNFLINSPYKYDPGTFGAINNKNYSTSFFGRLDWNISDKHKLAFRYNHVDGHQDLLSRSATSAIFSNSGYGFDSKANSVVLELNSTFSSKASNMLRITGTFMREKRTTSAFPNISITNYNPAAAANISYSIGSDFSSAVNGLNQDFYTITDNFSLYLNKHTLTFGTNNEFFKSTNFFLQGFYGAYTYNAGNNSTNNINNFLNNTGMTGYSVGFSTSSDPSDKAPAVLSAAQFSVYAQDVWQAAKNFKLTYGIRADLPVISSVPAANTAFNTAFASYDVATDVTPAKRILLSPRVGFNYDVDGDGKIVIRGGAGIFTGRIPFVWISNQIANTGVFSQNLSYTAAQITANGIKFNYNPSDPHLGAFIPSSYSNAGAVINVIDKNFKYPQVFRTNLAFDKKFDNSFGGFIGSLELVYTKTLNNADYTNLNISDNGDATVQIGSQTRPYWSKYTNTTYGNVLKLRNTNMGDAFNITVQLQKPLYKGWSGSLAYTYGYATSANDLTSSVAQSNWRAPLVTNGLNKPDLAFSNYYLGSRVVGFINKQFKYGKNFATTISLIYTGQSGQRLSYVLGSNILGDYGIGGTTGATTLAYIPSNFSEANLVDISNGKTASQQWADFLAFANANSYIKNNMGKNSKRNDDHLPWENHFDFRLAQDFMLGKHKLQLFVDVLNIGNLFNKEWGWSYGNGDGFFTYSYSLFSVVTSGAQKRDGAAVTAPTKNTPAFQFNINNFTNVKDQFRPYSVSDFTSRWSSQIGLKYSF
ncbi:MAG: TonB-dependent receptor [Sphingobacteriia bacterium]|nr:TonB-dependent receptor [Sphingobacteriia bacterium]